MNKKYLVIFIFLLFISGCSLTDKNIVAERTTDINCLDGDGYNVYTKSFIKGHYIKDKSYSEAYDFCIDINTLSEFYCERRYYNVDRYYCRMEGKLCFDGACV